MKLTARNIDELIAASEPQPTNVRSAEDYQAENQKSKDTLLAQLIAHKNTSSARVGEILPSLHSVAQRPRRSSGRDRGAPPELDAAQPNGDIDPRARLLSSRTEPHTYEPKTHERGLLDESMTSSRVEDSDEALSFQRRDAHNTHNAHDHDEDHDAHDGDDGKYYSAAQPAQVYLTTVPAALLGVNLAEINSRADLVKELTQRLPINDFGLPRFIYRADLLDLRVFQDHGYLEGSAELAEQYREMQDYLNVSTVHLDYSQGFPALSDGTPLWSRLPSEPAEHFNAFTDYCTQPGTRQLHKLIINTLNGAPIELQTLLHWYHEDYWQLRAKCYDLAHAVHQAKLREQRILGCEDKHFQLADALVERLSSFASEVDWNALKSEPDKYVKVMEAAIRLQRQALSLGTSTSTGTTMGRGAAATMTESVEMIMRKATAPELKMIRDQRAEDPTHGVSVRALLKNPEALASAQELIIRMSNTTQVNAPPLPDDMNQE